MKKKVKEENVGEIIGKVADQIRSEMDLDFRVAQSQMWIAENDLVETFTDEQLKLYNIYKEKREEFYAVANELYKRKF